MASFAGCESASLPTTKKDQELEVKTLPTDVLQHLAALLPQEERHGSFSLASHSTHAAAVAGAYDIDLTFSHSKDLNSFKQKGESFYAYMCKHGEAVRHLFVAERGALKLTQLQVMLPWQSMAQLRSLVCCCGLPIRTQSSNYAGHLPSSMPVMAAAAAAGAAAKAAAGTAVPSAEAVLAKLPPVGPCSSWSSLGALTALTGLCLHHCSFIEVADVCGWYASQLARITGLRTLVLQDEGEHKRNPGPSTPAGAAALVSTLTQLRQLTELDLRLQLPSLPLVWLSGMSQLQHLTLRVGSDEEPLQLGALPGSLTFLSLQEDCKFSGSSSLQLPLLQELQLKTAEAVDDKQYKRVLLARAPQLRKLDITCSFAGDLAGAWAVLPQLQHLQDIHVWGLDSWQEAAQYAAVTASSQLTSLKFHPYSLPAGAVQHMFPAERRLPLLQVLQVSTSPCGERWCIAPGDITGVVTCCPSLRILCYFSYKLCPDSNVSQDELQQLLQLTALEELAVGGERWDDNAVQAVLAHMTGLRSLSIEGASSISDLGLASLTRLTNLTDLFLYDCGRSQKGYVSFEHKGPGQSVSRQLQQHCTALGALACDQLTTVGLWKR